MPAKPASSLSVPVVVAILFLLAYLVFLYIMWGKIGAPENDWNRASYLFTGFESIVFAAAGFIFGREVNRQRAENAESRANEAEAKATDSTVKAEKGKSLAKAIRKKHSAVREEIQEGIYAPGDQINPPPVDDDLLIMANSLFPPDE